MPRSLSRLRYRAPPVSIAANEGLQARIERHVAVQSRPRHTKLQVFANPKARRPATGQTTIAPLKPFTLRDVVDPAGKAKHGEIIYIFRNNRTNQIIYSLQELLSDHHLEQLPFIGKHSTPPVIRPDDWTPHCVVTFPSVEQGHHAYRKLREFRKLHELSWDKTNPEWKLAPIKRRIKNIMNQRANTSADLAVVLKIQRRHGKETLEESNKRQEKENEYLDKKWAEINALAAAAKAKEKVADNVKWLEHQIRSLSMKLNLKHNKNEADQKRLKNAKIIQEIRLRKIQYAQRKTDQFKTMEEALTTKAAPANELGAEGKLDEYQKQATLLREAIATPDPERAATQLAEDQEILASLEADIKALEEAFEAKTQLESRDHYISRSILPRQMRKPLPIVFSLDGVRVRWADMRDALFAARQWPETIEHEDLAVNKERQGIALLTAEEYAQEQFNEITQITDTIRERKMAAHEEMMAARREAKAAAYAARMNA